MKDGTRCFFTLVKYEIISAKRYYAVLFIISVLLFSVTVSTFSAAVEIPKRYAEKIPPSMYFYGAESIVEVLNAGADYVVVPLPLDGPVFEFGDKVVYPKYGEAHTFRDELNKDTPLSRLDNPFAEGRQWNAEDNNEDYRNIWFSQSVARDLGVKIGDKIIPRIGSVAIPFFNLRVIGVYKESYSRNTVTDKILETTPYFVVSYAIVQKLVSLAGIEDGPWSGVVYDVSRISKVEKNLVDAGIGFVGNGELVSFVNIMNISKIAFWSVTAFLLFLGAATAYNLIRMILNTREKTHGLYRLLGITPRKLFGADFFGFLTVSAPRR
ncbi:MAG: hypothetical protein LBP79_00140 [Clostridiales bacterium]|jgi:hypothetical protein|nr:hypothetical protein [Clostridiales bacterium]